LSKLNIGVSDVSFPYGVKSFNEFLGCVGRHVQSNIVCLLGWLGQTLFPSVPNGLSYPLGLEASSGYKVVKAFCTGLGVGFNNTQTLEKITNNIGFI
jgi:hypothetical protein